MRDQAATVERSVVAGVTGTLLALAAVAWFLTVRQAGDMGGMVTGLGQVGVGMPNDMSAPLFLLMWLAMMVAMMFPAVAPIVSVHLTVSRSKGQGLLPTVVFVLGYLLVWTAAGLVPLGAFLAFRNLTSGAAWLPWLAGAVLIGAGLYQFTPIKTICLRACQNPLGFVLKHDWSGRWSGALKTGVSHGGFCLGCCWARRSC